MDKNLENDPNLVIIDHTLVNINHIYMLSFISDLFRINLTIYLSVTAYVSFPKY